MVVLALVALVTVEMVAPAAQALPATTAAPSGVAEQAIQLLNLVNSDRASAGLAPVHARTDVAAIAQDWTAQMVAAGTLSHNDAYFSPETHDAIGAQAEGENVGFAGSMEAVEIGFMNSPHHRANVLDPRFTAIGIGVQQSSSGAWWVTQDFLQEAGAPSAPVEAPAPDPAPIPTVDSSATTAEPVSAPTDALPPSAPAPTPEELTPSLPTGDITTAAGGEPQVLALPSVNTSGAGSTDSGPPIVILVAGAALLASDIAGLVASRRRRRIAARVASYR